MDAKSQFQIWSYQFPDKGGVHPAVLISHPDFCARATVINVLFCTSQKQDRDPKAREVVLDVADGLDWRTLCDCGQMYVVKSADLFGYRGHITWERRNAIREKLRDMFRIAARD